MFKRLLLSAFLLGAFGLTSLPASAQQVICPNRPSGDNTNNCASTKWVQANGDDYLLLREDELDLCFLELLGHEITLLAENTGFGIGWSLGNRRGRRRNLGGRGGIGGAGGSSGEEREDEEEG